MDSVVHQLPPPLGLQEPTLYPPNWCIPTPPVPPPPLPPAPPLFPRPVSAEQEQFCIPPPHQLCQHIPQQGSSSDPQSHPSADNDKTHHRPTQGRTHREPAHDKAQRRKMHQEPQRRPTQTRAQRQQQWRMPRKQARSDRTPHSSAPPNFSNRFTRVAQAHANAYKTFHRHQRTQRYRIQREEQQARSRLLKRMRKPPVRTVTDINLEYEQGRISLVLAECSARGDLFRMRSAELHSIPHTARPRPTLTLHQAFSQRAAIADEHETGRMNIVLAECSARGALQWLGKGIYPKPWHQHQQRHSLNPRTPMRNSCKLSTQSVQNPRFPVTLTQLSLV